MGADQKSSSAVSVPAVGEQPMDAMSKQAIEDVRPRKGTVLTGFAQIVTAVVGAGVLALPSALAALGWVGGIILLGTRVGAAQLSLTTTSTSTNQRHSCFCNHHLLHHALAH